ncbi:TPA: response regulator transcription factor [Klebsiella pneumoniae]|nr:response regulator transcription factor [Klebsiella pneumoniae]
MTNTIYTQNEVTLVSEIIWKIHQAKSSDELRKEILPDIGTLLNADFIASYVWSPKDSKSKQGYGWYISESALESYEKKWQFIDPITPLLRKSQRATCVDNVISRSTLEKSMFYNEFLKPNGMHYGINIYFVNNRVDLGDLRIWRREKSRNFGNREIALLNILESHFIQSLQRHVVFDSKLSERERQVVEQLRLGLSDKEIARNLGISFTTVRTHLSRAMVKQGSSNRTELAIGKKV